VPIIVDDEIAGVYGIAQDITQRRQIEEQIKAALKEKEVLIREVLHRVKNNLQVIISLLNLQGRMTRMTSNKEIQEQFTEIRNRIRAMSLIHEKLFRSDNLAAIDFPEYAGTITTELCNAYNASRKHITLELKLEKVQLEMDKAIPLGLLLNELFSNVMKHAFPEWWQGRPVVKVSLHQQADGKISLSVEDNGIGLPEDVNIEKSQSLGLYLVILLTEQLRGTWQVDRGQGIKWVISF
jgi:two-component sensor histidine kinase